MLKDIESLEFRVPEANVKLDLTMNALSNFPTYLQMDSSLLKKKRCAGLETNKALKRKEEGFRGQHNVGGHQRSFSKLTSSDQ